jgi:hypothetical protein
MTVLRLVMALPEPAWPTPRVLGVDEFAARKGRRYGTILGDCGSRQPLDLLPDRAADSVAAWLREHPGVEIVCRDRAAVFADGARTGAPQAPHCADEWHVWHNLAEAVERLVSRHRALLRDLVKPEPEPAPAAVETVEAAEEPAEPYPAGKFLDRLRDTHAAVRAQVEQGLSLREIARRLGLGRNTVRKYARAASPEALLHGQWQNRTSKLDPFKPYLEQRIADGCTTLSRLHRELQERGHGAATAHCATTSGHCVSIAELQETRRRSPALPRSAMQPGGSQAIPTTCEKTTNSSSRRCWPAHPNSRPPPATSAPLRPS